MSEELKKKLSSEIEVCSWSDLEDHYTRGAILIIDPSLELVNVGIAMANDNAELVGDWLSNQRIQKPTQEQKENWSKNPKSKIARFLIIQPYVLIQLLA